MTEEPGLDELSALVLECLERIEGSGISAIDEVCAEHPDRADALRSRMGLLLGTGLVGSDLDVPERLGDFRLGRRLGGGGMGVVYAAVQESLGREVALKLVRPDQLFFPETRERFEREVQLVARLQHPNIVPVYTVGEEKGVPYFAMERIEGATLAQALAVIDEPRHGRDLATALAQVSAVDVHGEIFAGNWTDTCLRIARDVAAALQHAHERDVVHRDVKPSNIMLAAEGRVLVFDFGLSREGGGERVTKTGSQVGSLAYMAPEQVRGEDADERTDVYGLGATLCELLTGAPPYAGRGEALGQAILVGDPVPLRRRNPAVPRDVETVCRKALAREPAQRYATAGEFARDLTAALERRPIEARRAGPVLRVVRWTQRHPARAAALLLAVIGPTALAIQQGVSVGRVAEQRDRAEANLDKALDALRVFLWEVGREELADMPRMEGVRLRLLEEALAFFEELMPQRPDDPDLLLRWAALQRSMAEVLGQLGRLPEAEAGYRAQLSVLRERETLDDAQNRVLVGCLNNLANVLERLDRGDEAIVAYDEALAHLGAPTDAQGRETVANVQRNRGLALMSAGRLDEAGDAYAAAIAAAEPLDDPYLLAAALNGHAELRSLEGDWPAADAAYSRAMSILIPLAAASPERREVVHEAATACMNAAALAAPPDREGILRAGMPLAEQLVADFPLSTEYARVRAKLLLNLGSHLAAMGRLVEAETYCERAAESGADLLAEDADDFDGLAIRGMALGNLATLRVQGERRVEACEPGAEAGELLERALALRPDDTMVRGNLVWAWIQEGYGRVASGDLARAEAVVARVSELAPNDPMAHVALAEVLAGCAPADRALDALERGLELGFPDRDYLRASVELQPIASSARFQALVGSP